MNLKRRLNGLDPTSRRHFLSGAARGLLGVGTLPWLNGIAAAVGRDDGELLLGPATARNVIYLYMAGGMSHLDTLDPKPGAETQGPTRSIRTAAEDVLLSEHFPLLAREMDKVAVINSMQSTVGAHEQARYLAHTSYELRGTIRHPSLGAWVSRMGGSLNDTLPAHISIGGSVYMASGGFFDARHAPLPIGDPAAGLQNSVRVEHVDDERFHGRMSRLQAMNREFLARHDLRQVRAYQKAYEQAVALMDSADLEAFDVTREPEPLRAAYGEGRFGQGCLLARRLVERGVRFVEVSTGGWDTHSENFERMAELCPPVDRALATLLADLDARGLLDETLVVLTTEFGRTPHIVEQRMGRNHYPQAFSSLMAGGGIVGGRKYGRTDELGETVIEDPVHVTDLNATIAHALGLPLEHVVTSPAGRPFTIAHKGRPVTELFG